MDRLTSADAGCWIDGHHGQYGTPMMLRIATERGYKIPGEHSKTIMAKAIEWLNGIEIEAGWSESVIEATDDAERWLNENIAPEGFSFGWHDGEFFLWSDAEWGWEEV